MKLPLLLYILLVIFNFLSLCLLLDLFSCGAIKDCLLGGQGRGYARFMAYWLYVTILLNLYGLFYIAIRKAFEK